MQARWFSGVAGAVAICALLGGGLLVGPARAGQREVRAEHGAVVSVSEPASEVGVQILKQGGSAVDAAVAVALALAVTHPAAGNIGGGGFMMVLPGPGQEPVCVDYRETAPAAARANTFVDDLRRHGHKTVGIPGTVAGLALAHQKYGRLKWAELVAPAVRLADEGFAMDAPLARSLNGILADSRDFAELRRVFAKPDGMAWQAGDRLVQKDLAGTLARLADEGPAVFYRGKVAEQLVAEMQAGGGLIAAADLAGYQAKLRQPIHGTFRGYDVYGPPPPSSGGTCLVQMLGVLEQFPLAEQGRYAPQTLHLMIEAMRRAYRDRAAFLGDGDFVQIPGYLTSKQYARKLAAGIDPAQATPSQSLAGDIHLAAEGDSTTHFSVVDARGMAVSNTYTLEQSYGSRVVVRGAGFLLNDEMGDFNLRPGLTDRQGTIGTKPNQIEPGKRMLSSQTPTIVTREGKLVLVTGSPGGRTIINTVLCVVLSVLEFDMDLRDAVDAPRMHHQWFPDSVRMEGRNKPELAAALERLKAMGHTIEESSGKQGDAHSIRAMDGKLHGVADGRISGHAAGY